MPVSKDDITEVFGELDEEIIAEIEKLDPSAEDLSRAREWIYSTSVAGDRSAKVAQIVRIVGDALDDEDIDDVPTEQG